LWSLWHLSFLYTDTSLGQEGLFLLALVGGSFGLGRVVAETRSVCAAAGFQFAINILFLSGVVQVTFARGLVLVGICALLWASLLWGWSDHAETEEGRECGESSTAA